MLSVREKNRGSLSLGGCLAGVSPAATVGAGATGLDAAGGMGATGLVAADGVGAGAGAGELAGAFAAG